MKDDDAALLLVLVMMMLIVMAVAGEGVRVCGLWVGCCGGM